MDLLAESFQEERYIINDLLLEVNHSYFQIDTLIISQGVIHLLDIKKFQGDWYLESDKLYAVTTRREHKNPVDQLKRCKTFSTNCSLVTSKITLLIPKLSLSTPNSPYTKPQWTTHNFTNPVESFFERYK